MPRNARPDAGHATDAALPDARAQESIPWDFDLTPAIDARINALAHAGRNDPVARNELHSLLSGKIARFLAPWRGRPTALGDFADIRQESFLVFAGLVADWPGEGSFARYFLGFFPWRLRHAIEAHARRWPLDRLVIVPERVLLDDLSPVEDTTDPLIALWPLAVDDRQLLALRLAAGYSVAEAAHLLGWSRRKGFRRWRALVARLSQDPAATPVADDHRCAS
jgi:DNA-directed RNA polymerase specialized sigma24 family protein